MATPEVIIILGCRTNPDGTASEMMRYRVKQAATVYDSLVTDGEKPSHPWVIATGYQAPGDQVQPYTLPFSSFTWFCFHMKELIHSEITQN